MIVLPGICGSHLAVDGERVWLSLRLVGGLERLQYPDRGRVTADGAIGPIYDDLQAHLAATHEVIEFSYDWRRPVEEEARRLAHVAEGALAARAASGQPVRFVAHSMGGIVVRTLQLEAPELFERLLARPGARVLMLGTPNGGSWAPMQVLSGDDTFGNTLATFGAPFQDVQARRLMAAMPGFLQLQAALTDTAQGLAEQATWQRLADDDVAAIREHNRWHSATEQIEAYVWGVPPQGVLDQARRLRERLDAQRERDLPRFADRVLLVVGRARFTPDGFTFDGARGLQYLDAVEAGDGRVTRASARLPGVRTWSVDCEHGTLPDHAAAFPAYVELLEHGGTSALEQLPDLLRSRTAPVLAPAVQHVPSRPSRDGAAARPPSSVREVGRLATEERLDATAPAEAAEALPPLPVALVNGNLKYVRQPLLVGHYRSTTLSGTEWVVDLLLGGAMRTALGTGLYPNAPGTHQVFVNAAVPLDNPLQMPRPEAAIVLGLGDEGELRPGDLALTVRQGIMAWAQRQAEAGRGPAEGFELAAALVGSGGTGITAGVAAQMIARGAREARLRLAASRWPNLSRLVLVELYLDRASEAWRALQVLATATPGWYDIAPTVRSGPGALRRGLDAGYRGADYDLLSAVHPKGRAAWDTRIEYTIDTRRARSEVRAQATQSRLLDELVRQASNDWQHDRQIGRTLHQLLIPPEMDPFFGGSTEMRLELDELTARIPWELLDMTSRGGGERTPWAIRTKVLRKLRTVEFRADVSAADREARVLLIGEPDCDRTRYGELPAARKEVAAIRDRLCQALGPSRVRALIGGEARVDAQTVINTLLEQDWRIVHIAGHGEPPEFLAAALAEADARAAAAGGDPRGVVLSDGTFLGPREIGNMRTVPELVFVNCCHLAVKAPDAPPPGAASDRLTGGQGYERPRFAAGVAEALIRIGVRCVIAAGWAVEDDAARTFATSFYTALLNDMRFVDAVAMARADAFDKGGNTWAAYQCYGDPDWHFERGAGSTSAPPRSPAEVFAGVSSPLGLTLALEQIAVESREGLGGDAAAEKARLERQQARLRWLERRFGALWGGMGAVAEAFAVAWAACGEDDDALRWYRSAVRCNDGSASLKAQEQVASLNAREAWRSALAAAPRSKAFADARMDLARTVEALRTLAGWQPTIERLALVGSALKQLSMVEQHGGNAGAALAARLAATDAYRESETIARRTQDPNLPYPGLNRMSLELVQALEDGRDAGFDATHTAALRAVLTEKNRTDADFWSIVGLIEIDLYEALGGRRLRHALEALLGAYTNLFERVSAPQHWASVMNHTAYVLDAYRRHAPRDEAAAAQALAARLAVFADDGGTEGAVSGRR